MSKLDPWKEVDRELRRITIVYWSWVALLLGTIFVMYLVSR